MVLVLSGDVAIDMDEGEAAPGSLAFHLGVVSLNQALCSVTLVVGRRGRRPWRSKARAPRYECGPGLRQALEAVEPVRLPLSDQAFAMKRAVPPLNTPNSRKAPSSVT